MNHWRFLSISCLGAVLAIGCVAANDDDETSRDCAPNEQQMCECDNGDQGTQVCNSAGSAFSPCDCDGSDPDGGSNGNMNAGMDGGSADASADRDGGGSADGGGSDAGMVDFFNQCSLCAEQEGTCAAELEACLASEGTCGEGAELGDYGCVLTCVDIKRNASGGALLSGAEVRDCVEDICGISNDWPDGADPTLEPLLDCLAGNSTWAGMSLADGGLQPGKWAAPAADNCSSECFGAGG